MGKRNDPQIVLDSNYVKGLTGHKVMKCCISCRYAETGDANKIYCCKACESVGKYGICRDFELKARYHVIGKSQGKTKNFEYYKWRLSIIDKFTRGGNTDWKLHDEYLKGFGKNIYKYWQDNIKK